MLVITRCVNESIVVNGTLEIHVTDIGRDRVRLKWTFKRESRRPSGVDSEGEYSMNQTVDFGNQVTVTVVDFRRDKVRLGICAPREMSVHRREVWDAIRRTDAEA